jgi:hypothetical protein
MGQPGPFDIFGASPGAIMTRELTLIPENELCMRSAGASPYNATFALRDRAYLGWIEAVRSLRAATWRDAKDAVLWELQILC